MRFGCVPRTDEFAPHDEIRRGSAENIEIVFNRSIETRNVRSSFRFQLLQRERNKNVQINYYIILPFTRSRSIRFTKICIIYIIIKYKLASVRLHYYILQICAKLNETIYIYIAVKLGKGGRLKYLFGQVYSNYPACTCSFGIC